MYRLKAVYKFPSHVTCPCSFPCEMLLFAFPSLVFPVFVQHRQNGKVMLQDPSGVNLISSNSNLSGALGVQNLECFLVFILNCDRNSLPEPASKVSRLSCILCWTRVLHASSLLTACLKHSVSTRDATQPRCYGLLPWQRVCTTGMTMYRCTVSRI